MNESQLQELGIELKWLDPINQALKKYALDSNRRIAAFIGQCQHESGNFKLVKENLNYSAESLMKTWPSRFPDLDTANQYAHNQEKIANKVYAGRMGNTEDGDGFKYIGRGVIQITGKDNYKNCGEALGLDLLDNPDLISEPTGAVLSAGWFWNKHGLNILADAQDYTNMTKRINGGILGLDDRVMKINKVLDVLE
jgi:putative chitinase